MPSQLKSLVLRAPGIYGLSTEGEQVQASPEFAREANNVAYDSVGRLGNRKGFSSTSSKYALTLPNGTGANSITTDSASDAADTDALAAAQQPSESDTAPGTFPFTMVGGSLPPTAPRFVSATTAGSSDGSKTVTITGTDVTDTAVTEILTLAGSASTVLGSQLFKTVTSATKSAAPAANVVTPVAYTVA